MKNKKLTKKRKMILDIFKNGDLLTANDICKKLPSIDRATVYRSLTYFVQMGFLREVNIKKGVSSFEILAPGDNHQHFICEKCNKVVHIQIDKNIVRNFVPSEYEVKSFELNLKGRCKKCKTY